MQKKIQFWMKKQETNKQSKLEFANELRWLPLKRKSEFKKLWSKKIVPFDLWIVGNSEC